MENIEEMIKILEDTIDKKDKIIADYKNMCDNYIKLIHDCTFSFLQTLTSEHLY